MYIGSPSPMPVEIAAATLATAVILSLSSFFKLRPTTKEQGFYSLSFYLSQSLVDMNFFGAWRSSLDFKLISFILQVLLACSFSLVLVVTLAFI